MLCILGNCEAQIWRRVELRHQKAISAEDFRSLARISTAYSKSQFIWCLAPSTAKQNSAGWFWNRIRCMRRRQVIIINLEVGVQGNYVGQGVSVLAIVRSELVLLDMVFWKKTKNTADSFKSKKAKMILLSGGKPFNGFMSWVLVSMPITNTQVMFQLFATKFSKVLTGYVYHSAFHGIKLWPSPGICNLGWAWRHCSSY